MEDVKNLDTIEIEEKNKDASKRSKLTNSIHPHSTPEIAARHEACGSPSAGPLSPTLLGNGVAPNAPMRPGGM